jgi:hypothetical protein
MSEVDYLNIIDSLQKVLREKDAELSKNKQAHKQEISDDGVVVAELELKIQELQLKVKNLRDYRDQLCNDAFALARERDCLLKFVLAFLIDPIMINQLRSKVHAEVKRLQRIKVFSTETGCIDTISEEIVDSIFPLPIANVSPST